jgi:DNA mismatch repair ATPase MutL
VERELLEIEWTGSEKLGRPKISGLISGPNLRGAKLQFLCFVNDRLVSCEPIKRAVLSIYEDLLPKHAQPFVYLSLSISPTLIDVNVHPTKEQVRFLHENEICHELINICREILPRADVSRTFPINIQEKSHPAASPKKLKNQVFEFQVYKIFIHLSSTQILLEWDNTQISTSSCQSVNVQSLHESL